MDANKIFFFFFFFSPVSGELYQGEIQHVPPPPPPPHLLDYSPIFTKANISNGLPETLINYVLPLGQTSSSAKMAAACRNFVVCSQASLSISVTSLRQYSLKMVHGAFLLN